jgi:hypothetical protein
MADDLDRLLAGVDPRLANIARQIIAESGGAISITGHGGFRSREQQAKMYQDYLNGGNLAARPGHSMHERGLAIDFKTKDYDLLAQLASKHGLVNSVPGEPWHWTMGDDAGGGDDDVTLPYDIGQTENPEDALANRLNAVFSMMGGAGPAGVEPMGTDVLNTVDAQEVQENPANQAAQVDVTQMTGNSMGQYAMAKFAQFGWGPEELQALTVLWNRESGDPKASTITWNPRADNPTSSAAGIAQKMTSIHGPLEPSWQGQIDWGLQYIAGRYGSPSRALRFHDKNNWY